LPTRTGVLHFGSGQRVVGRAKVISVQIHCAQIFTEK
jgi:hypothetical protein